MITDENLPDGWGASAERREYDQVMDREYETKAYEREDGDVKVHINEIQEPEDFDGWGFRVIAAYATDDDVPTREDDLGIFEELDEAREVDVDYMEDHEE